MRDGWIGHHCFRVTAFHYPAGWHFSGAWTWNNRAAVVGDFNNDGLSDYARFGATYIHFFISRGDGSFFWPIYHFPGGWNFGWNEWVWTTMAGHFEGGCRTHVLRTSGRYVCVLLVDSCERMMQLRVI